jgi:hypothetical protein
MPRFQLKTFTDCSDTRCNQRVGSLNVFFTFSNNAMEKSLDTQEAESDRWSCWIESRTEGFILNKILRIIDKALKKRSYPFFAITMPDIGNKALEVLRADVPFHDIVIHG